MLSNKKQSNIGNCAKKLLNYEKLSRPKENNQKLTCASATNGMCAKAKWYVAHSLDLDVMAFEKHAAPRVKYLAESKF